MHMIVLVVGCYFGWEVLFRVVFGDVGFGAK